MAKKVALFATHVNPSAAKMYTSQQRMGSLGAHGYPQVRGGTVKTRVLAVSIKVDGGVGVVAQQHGHCMEQLIGARPNAAALDRVG